MQTITIDARQFRARMTKLGILIQSSEIAKVAGLDILTWVADNFQSEGRAGGGPGWAPLAPSTIARRRKGPRAGARDRILQDTGRLKQSFIPGRPENVFRQFGGKGVDVGTTLHYAPIHELGAGRIPQRKMMPTHDQAQLIAARAIEAIISQRSKRI